MKLKNSLLTLNLFICNTLYGDQDFWCWIKKNLDANQIVKTFSPINSFENMTSKLAGIKPLEFDLFQNSPLNFDPSINFDENLIINFVLKDIEFDYRKYCKLVYPTQKSFLFKDWYQNSLGTADYD